MLFIVLLLLVLNDEKCYNCKNNDNDNDENEAYFLDISSREVLSFFNCFCSGLLGCFLFSCKIVNLKMDFL